jgi:hypothetical protein
MMAMSAALSHSGHAPGWVGAVAAVGVVLAFMLCAPWLAARSLRRRRLGDDSDDGDGFGGGGGGRRPTPPNRPPDADPEWWPEFEREFATYVERLPVPA